ncbi:hypothetical protein NE542_15485 [Faecalibacillus intestinalis]|uniref:Uncharacterized protein n=2 Tax=Faecalibacillus intestinalis TaxID=1982626 RepID=A0AAP2UIB1_9FIRM|nr:hypothetical protein [Faecalibacillus intestinalis]MCB8614763.1 hypothetical protein [Faecalibacillus intestinalis]MCQ5063215.1 hypothetical protein [Faecalibacillus intestinalis]
MIIVSIQSTFLNTLFYLALTIDIRYDEDDFELNVTISAPSTNNEDQDTTDTTDDDQEIDEED